MRLLSRLRRPEGSADEDELMPDWLVARLAAVYAGLMAYGGRTLCDTRRAGFGAENAWCSVFVRDEQWVVLIAGPGGPGHARGAGAAARTRPALPRLAGPRAR